MFILTGGGGFILRGRILFTRRILLLVMTWDVGREGGWE